MLRNIITLALILAFANLGSAYSQNKPQAKQLSTRKNPVGIIAHRGFHKYDGCAENSIASMQNAIDHDLFGTEFDVRITGDNVAILYHDNLLQGLPIEELPLNELQHHPAFMLSNGEPIPTLKDFFDAYHKSRTLQQKRNTTTRLFYEIKPQQQPDKLELAISSAFEMVKQHDCLKDIIFISFSLDACKMMHQRLPEVAIGYLGGDIEPSALHEMGISIIDYNYKVYSAHPEWIAKAHELGMKVVAWTVNDKQTAISLAKMGVDYITTDTPLDAAQWLNE